VKSASTASELSPLQTAALTTVTHDGRTEVAASVRFADGVARAWPAYRGLRDAEALWLMRARGGWYRTSKEGADAYTVLTAAQRPEVEHERAVLARLDKPRVHAANAASKAIRTARAALKGLVQ
jgi:hypothetical protein